MAPEDEWAGEDPGAPGDWEDVGAGEAQAQIQAHIARVAGPRDVEVGLDDPEDGLPNVSSVAAIQFLQDQAAVAEFTITGVELAEPAPLPLALLSPRGFLTGRAGTGKTFLARELAARDRSIWLAATTGIAAVNLGTTTINSLLGYFDTASLKDSFVNGWVTQKLRKHYNEGLRRLVVDEVSMMDGDQLTTICQAFDEVNEWLAGQKGVAEEDLLKLTLTGDFCQLPPIKAKFAFEVPAWASFAEGMTKLTTVRRQADPLFIEALDAARSGVGYRAGEILAPRFHEQLDHHFDGTTVFAKNEEVERFNGMRLAELQGRPVQFLPERWGTAKSEWKNIPDALDLKEGALVMCLANMKEAWPSRAYRYVNGDLGTVVGRSPYVDAETGKQQAGCVVKLHRNQREVMVEYVERANWATLEPGRKKALMAERGEDWESYLDDKGTLEKIGAVSYMPLRLAWGTTTHKSQGLSLDTVQINFRDHFFKSPAMCYVALSRGRSMEGLRLVGTPRVLVDKCSTDARVRPWI